MNQPTALNQANAPMPRIPFGPHQLSRLILGANTINGGSHLSRFVNLQMRRFFTTERILQLLRDCEAQGINTWQSGPNNLDLYRQHREQGGTLQFISLAAQDPQDPHVVVRLAEAGTIAVAYHGEVTDTLYKEGQIDSIRDFLRQVRDAGMRVGISTHMPAVVDYVEAKGWDVDFYMTCVYERHRTREELKALLGYVPIPIREVYMEEDPPRMWQAMRQTAKPCLGFKILAAGRVCDRQETVERAFEATFRGIKAHDAVILGIYPEYEDQVQLDADYVRRFSALSQA
jgi:hypothetical protein